MIVTTTRTELDATADDSTGPEAAAGPPTTTPAGQAAQLDGFGPIARQTARMIACDGEITEVVVDAHGRPLVVKETGKPTRKQRLAVLARDGSCIGCGAPASGCQLHHLVWRRCNGATVVIISLVARTPPDNQQEEDQKGASPTSVANGREGVASKNWRGYFIRRRGWLDTNHLKSGSTGNFYTWTATRS